MADATETLMVVVDRDAMRRVRSVDIYRPGEAPPDEIADYLPHEVRLRETQTKDPRDEVKTSEVKHKGAGYYKLPNGETVRGKDAVREAGFDPDT